MKTFVLYFTIKKNKKQIYIDSYENEQFKSVIQNLEVKYNWLKSIHNKIYKYNGKEIHNFDLSNKDLEICDNSKIIIIYL